MTIHTSTLVRTSARAIERPFSYGDQQGEADYLVIAAGRGPDVEGLGLDEAGIELDERGLDQGRRRLRTSVKGVYAIGDLVRGPALAHKASDEGVIAVEDAAGLRDPPDRVHRHPARDVLLAQRRVVRAHRGAGREQGWTSSWARSTTGAVGAGTVYGDRSGVIKVIGDKQYGELVGGHIVGAQGDGAHPELVNARALRAASRRSRGSSTATRRSPRA
jgi:dihydrolipoamide dehydrogenase